MKLIFVSDTLSSGGTERVVSILANYFSKKYETEIICLRKMETFYPLEPSVNVVYANDGHGSWLKKLLWLRRYIQKDDVVVPFMVKVYCVVLLSLIGKKNTIIASERNDPRTTAPAWKVLRRCLLHKVNTLVVQTNDIKNYFWQGIRSRIEIIMNPLEPKQCSDATWNRESKLILAIGRTDEQKNYPMMIRAFNRIRMNHPDYRLEIWGNRNQTGEIVREL